MKLSIFGFLLFAYICGNEAATLFSKLEEDVGKPLLLTEYIENGKIEEGKEKALVKHHELKGVTSYSGFITIDKKYDSNSFFWYFLSKSNPSKDPLLMWLNGGPASASESAIFNYNGPYIVHKNQTVSMREHTLLKNHNVIYLDNPLGTGFSFTNNTDGYANTEKDIDRDIVNFLVQFFQLFPEYRNNDFYVIGDSYSGKYCSSLPMAIKKYNEGVDEISRINIKGSAMGNGLVNPPAQTRLHDLIYHIGLVDHNGRKQIQVLYDLGILLNDLKKMINSTEFIRLYYAINTIKKDFFKLRTGYNYDQNFLITDRSEDKLYYESYIVTPDVRKAIHVGDLEWDEFNMTAQLYVTDTMASEAASLEQTLDNFKVLIYNGQMDLIAPYPTSEEFYLSLNWTAAEEYKVADRKLWKVDDELAGYWKTAGNLQEVMVRNSGHVVSYDQPRWYCDMMTRFTRDDIPE